MSAPAKVSPQQHRKACDHIRSVDPTMGRVIDHIGMDARLTRRMEQPYQSLVRAIVNQQLSSEAAATIFKRFVALFPDNVFPTPELVLKMEIDMLRTAGLSRPKACYIRDIAQHVVNGVLPTLEECDKLTDEEIILRLTDIKGIGRWTAQMFLMFNLGRPDVLPVHDLGVRKGFQIAFKKRKLPEPEQLHRYGKRWEPYRSTASLYLWRAVDFLNGDNW